MVIGVNGLTGMAVVLPVDLVRRQDRDSAQIQNLSMEGIIAQEQTRSIKYVKLAAAQVIDTILIIYVYKICCYFMVEKVHTCLIEATYIPLERT